MKAANERFAEVRKHHGLSMAAFGKMIGLSASGVSAIEYGTRALSDKHIKLICAEFPEINEDWLRGTSDTMFAPPSDPDLLQKLVSSAGGNEFVLALARSWLKLDEAQRGVLNRFIDDVVEDYRTSRAENALAATAEAVEAAADEIVEEIAENSEKNQLAN